jgi:hypothetical protein
LLANEVAERRRALDWQAPIERGQLTLGRWHQRERVALHANQESGDR